MISALLRKRELRIRQNILKGVYEDNLKIIGIRRPVIARNRLFYVKKAVPILFIAVLFALGHWDYIKISSFSEKEVTASPALQKNLLPFNPAVPPAGDMLSAADYQGLLSSPDISISRVFGLGVKTIMIDPGHGGTDPGAIGKMGTMEKDITLDIARRLRERLLKYGTYNILMTRNDDSTLPLNKRVELARMSKADIFISIHLNYLPSKPINIIETYFFGPSSDEKVLKLAEKENAGSHYGMNDFKDMIEKIGETLKLQESRTLALSIQKSLFVNSSRNKGDIYDFGVKRAPFVVLLGVDVPAVLAEVSCLSNKKEEVELNDERHRDNIARYLEAGILDYLHKGELQYAAKRRAD